MCEKQKAPSNFLQEETEVLVSHFQHYLPACIKTAFKTWFRSVELLKYLRNLAIQQRTFLQNARSFCQMALSTSWIPSFGGVD